MKESSQTDPRAKLLWVLACASVVCVASPFLVAGYCGLAFVGLLLASRGRPAYQGGAVLLFGFYGSVIAVGLVLEPTLEGMAHLMAAAGKWFTIAFSVLTFLASTSASDVLVAVSALPLPRPIAMSSAFGARILPAALEEAEKILLAQRARGLGAGGWLSRIRRLPRTIQCLGLPLIVQMLETMRNMYLVSQLRGMWEQEHPFGEQTLVPSWRNVGVIVLAVAVIACSLIDLSVSLAAESFMR